MVCAGRWGLLDLVWKVDEGRRCKVLLRLEIQLKERVVFF